MTVLINRFSIMLLALAAFSIAISAQIDPNPNSISPTLISGDDTSRALASSGNGKAKSLPSKNTSSFAPKTIINLFVQVEGLPESEKANAFRVYAKDSQNRMYRFPVISIDRISKTKPLYAMQVELKDEVGFWSQPKGDGDILIQVAWRGLGSNKLLLGLGKTGGLKFEPDDEKKSVDTNGPTEEYVGYKWSGDRKRLLEQATFGSTPELDQRVRRIGPRVWLAEQLAAGYPTGTNPYPDIPLMPNQVQVGCPQPRTTPEYRECVRDHYSQYQLITWFFREALHGDSQLRHRAAWALAQLWVTSGQTIQQSSHMIAYHKVLSQHALGNYRDLMRDMTLNAAMGDYLDMARSTRFNPNENFAREILQLFTVGLFMLNPDGTVQTDTSGNPVPTYDQETVNNFTKVFTGFTFCNVGCANSGNGVINFKDPLFLIQNNHDTTAKTLLDYPGAVNKNIAAGLNGTVELELALDNIFNHPNLGPFVGRYLIQQMVTSDPTPAYVGRVTAAFDNNGAGVRGDMKAVLKAILLDPEARGDEKTDPNFGKLREPVTHTTNFYRHFNVASFDGSQDSDGAIYFLPQLMGQLPFYSPTVFNFYTPNYVVPGAGLLAPEFGILNTGSAIQRTNMATIMAFVPLAPGTENPPDIYLGTSINVDDLIQSSANDPTGGLLLDALDRRMMHSTMSPEMRQEILEAVVAIPSSENDFRVRTVLFLIASSSQYQIQR